jgi:phage terminase large subunit-like protein
MDGVGGTGGSTFDNARNLPADYLEQITELYDGTRTGRQELHGELLLDVPGALFKEEWLRRADISAEMLETVTVGVDPSSCTVKSDATGIVVAALLKGGKEYAVLEDCTIKGSPGTWGDTVVQAYDRHKAVDVVVESNHGGNLAKHVIEEAARRQYHFGKRDNGTIRIRIETASKGRVMRAHAVSLLYEKNAVTHAPGLQALESELLSFSDDWDRGRDGSPNRLDAAVWALERLRGIKHVIVV